MNGDTLEIPRQMCFYVNLNKKINIIMTSNVKNNNKNKKKKHEKTDIPMMRYLKWWKPKLSAYSTLFYFYFLPATQKKKKKQIKRQKKY